MSSAAQLPRRGRRPVHPALVALLLLAIGSLGTGCSNPDRGAWWYRHPGQGDAHGIEQVLGGTGAWTTGQLVSELGDCEITRVYGSYGPMTGTPDTAQVAAFNAQLDAAGIDSQFLFSDPAYMTNVPSLLANIDSRVLAFNGAHPPAEQFDAIHLDVEPVQYPECKIATLDPVGCHGRVQELLTMIFQVRDHLDLADNGREMELYVDLHEWLDIVEGGRIFWPPAPTPEFSRDSWFQALDGLVDGVSIMAYGKTDLNAIAAAIDYERNNLTSEVRVGINLDDGNNFPDVASMILAAQWLELQGDVKVDLHSLNETLEFGGCD